MEKRIIQGNVDSSFGNLDIEGDLIITGDIKSGVKIRTSGGVKVMGMVEDADIIAQGNVEIAKAFIGQGNGNIQAKGSVCVNSIRNQRIFAESEIRIAEEAFQAQLTCDEAIFIEKGKGILSGGTTRAGTYLHVNELGNAMGSKTLIYVGDNVKFDMLIKRYKNELKEKNELWRKSKTMVEDLMERKYKSGWDAEQENIYRSAEKNLVDLPPLLDNIKSQILQTEQFRKQLKKDAYVRVNKQVFPGVVIRIFGLPRKLETEQGASLFYIADNEVIIRFI
jgi:uncharacterized protein (DUF342 family)